MFFPRKKSIQKIISIAIILSCPSEVLAAIDDRRVPSYFHKDANGSLIPEQKAIVDFVGQSMLEFTAGDQKMLVSDRILDGFEAGQSSVKLANGTLLSWGFKYQEPNIQSVVVADGEGKLKIVAAVTNITRLTRTGRRPVATMEEYQNKIKNSFGGQPSITLFFDQEKEFSTYWPVIKRWLQADLLGFNADCDSQDLSETCRLAEEVEIPSTAYRLKKSSNMSQVDIEKAVVPQVGAENFSVKLFKQ